VDVCGSSVTSLSKGGSASIPLENGWRNDVSDRPNIVFIMTDQQSFNMMSCAGNPYLKTPAMDSLAAEGVRFERAYCANPVCIPSRYSLFTGNLPSKIGLINNNLTEVSPPTEADRRMAMGLLLRDAGYRTAYAGTMHFPHMTAEDVGFEVISKEEREGLGKATAEFIRSRPAEPFCLAASFINPHDICYMAIRDSQQTEKEQRQVRNGGAAIAALDRALVRPAGMSEEEFYEKVCPPLPANVEVPANEPEVISAALAAFPFRVKARREWSDRRWREHRYAYARLTEFADQNIGELLGALRETGLDKNTLIIFTSDHGDMDASHRLEHKSMLYDEACRIPFIVRPPGGMSGRVDRSHLVSNGLDVLPTICDYAGIRAPATAQGRSCRPVLEGAGGTEWRKFVPVETGVGRAVVSEKYKYCVYELSSKPERLIDLDEDPGEMGDVAEDPRHAAALKEHREAFGRIFGTTPRDSNVIKRSL
jgi:choline-sulfatase